MSSQNQIQVLLEKIGAIDSERVVKFYPKVRDRDDVGVLRCAKTGVIFLDRSDHISMEHYTEMDDLQYWGSKDRQAAIKGTYPDDSRRATQILEFIENKKWVDVGSGLGGILDIVGGFASEFSAVEPQKFIRKSLVDKGYDVKASVKEVKDNSVDVITLFHVLEHFIDPVNELNEIYKKLKVGGILFVEVPHANDFLLSKLDSDAFKAFTFWSEHLILHTKESITKLLEHASFDAIDVNYFQRYPIANHLYWLGKNEPGGHEKWKDLTTDVLDEAYSQMLMMNGLTDTLIVTAVKK